MPSPSVSSTSVSMTSYAACVSSLSRPATLSHRSTVNASASRPAVMTVAIEASSSTSSARLDILRPSLLRHRQVHAEMRPPAGFVALVADPAIHVAHELVDQRQPEPLPVLLARDERLEDVVAQRRVDPGPVVADLDLDRQLHRAAEADDVHHQTADEAGADDDL